MREKTATVFWVVLPIFLLISVLLFLAVLVLSLLVMFGQTIGHDASWIYESLGVANKEKAEVLKTFGFTIAGIVAFWGVVVANIRADAMTESAEATADSAEATADSAEAAADSAKAAAKSVEATEAGNRQRAFKDGVEQLGREKASVRQGGAHALFHLALKDEGLRASVAGVLCAHIRETTSDKDYQEQNKDKPSTEVQSLLRLLFTTETVDEGRLEKFWQGITPDLSGGYFCGMKLRSARFQGAELDSARFHGASLSDAQFHGASLSDAQFHGAFLWEAQFQGANVGGGEFYGASLSEAQFQGANLEDAKFQGASLEDAKFQGASLSAAKFQRAKLRGGQFQGAWLWMAEFQQAQFEKDSEYEGDTDQEHMVAHLDELVEKSKASAFHGISSEPDHEFRDLASFEERINDRAGKESDFFGVVFSGGMIERELAYIKTALDSVPWYSNSSDFKERFIKSLESEIGKPAIYTPPKEVIDGAGSYNKEDAARWIREFREAMAKAL